MSFGGAAYSQAFADAIRRAHLKGALVVTGAGNAPPPNGLPTNVDAAPFYPCAYKEPNVVCVAASDDADLLAGFSNYGKMSVDLVAPGDNILSYGTGGSLAYYSGTSMAAPHVSGAAAVALAKWNLPANAIKSLLLNSADSKTSFTNKVATGARLNLNTTVSGHSFAVYPEEFDLRWGPLAATVG